MNFRRKTSERGKNLKMWPLRFLGSCVYTQVPNQLILKWGDYLGNPDLIRGVKRLFLFLYDNTHTHVEGCALYPVPVPKPQYWTRQFTVLCVWPSWGHLKDQRQWNGMALRVGQPRIPVAISFFSWIPKLGFWQDSLYPPKNPECSLFCAGFLHWVSVSTLGYLVSFADRSTSKSPTHDLYGFNPMEQFINLSL